MYFDAGAKLYIESTGYINQTAYNNGHELRIFVYPSNWAWSKSAATRNVGTNAYPGVYFTVPTTGLHRVTGYMYPSGGTRTGTVTWNGSMVYQDSTFQQNSIWKTVDNGTAHTTFWPSARPVCSTFRRWRSYYKSGIYYSANETMTLNTTSADSSYRVYFLAEWNDYANSSTSYGACSKKCGGGTRTKTVTRTDKSTGDTCHNGVTTTNEACNTTDCCASKVVSHYGSWSSCSKSCGTGTQSRTVYYKSSYDGNVSCGTSTQTQNCNTHTCCSSTTPSYGSWSACSQPCGTGTQTRTVTNKSTYDGSVCSTSTQSQNCNTAGCKLAVFPSQARERAGGTGDYVQCTTAGRYIFVYAPFQWRATTLRSYYGLAKDAPVHSSWSGTDLSGQNYGGTWAKGWFSTNPPLSPASAREALIIPTKYKAWVNNVNYARSVSLSGYAYYVKRWGQYYFEISGVSATTGRTLDSAATERVGCINIDPKPANNN